MYGGIWELGAIILGMGLCAVGAEVARHSLRHRIAIAASIRSGRG